MVMSKPERYDFIGLSTDTKPTPETSERVVNGSTYYTADDSKLYVFCDGEWYERQPLGGGGGGGGGDDTRGLAKELTDDDVNGNSSDWDDTDESHFNAVAAWKLAPGIYRRSPSMTKSLYIAPYNTVGSDGTFIVSTLGDYGYGVLLVRARYESGVLGTPVGHWYVITRVNSILNDGPLSPLVVNNLTSTYSNSPLSANQGKILNDKITALEARVAALEG